MKTNDIAEQLEYYFKNDLKQNALILARKEFVSGNKAPYIWCFLTDACCSIGKYARCGKILANKALEIINTELKNDKDNEKLLLYSAIINLNLENYEVTKAITKKLININDEKGIYYYLLAIECYEQKDFENGLLYINKAIKLEPDNAKYYYERGCSKGELHDWQGELQDQLKAIELNPNKAKYYYRVGIDYNNLENYEKATKYFTKATELNLAHNPKMLQKYENTLQDLYKAERNLENKFIISCCEKAKLIFSEKSTFFDNKQKKAINILLDALKVCENKKDILFTALSFMYFAQNDYQKALKYANEAILFNSENGTGYYRKYCALSALGKQNIARKYLEKANKFGYTECF